MDFSTLEHLAIAIGIQVLLWPVLGIFAAGWVSCAVFLGREIAQHEYYLGIHRGWEWGQQLPVKWYEGAIYHWTLDSILDFLAPVLACLIVSLIVRKISSS